MFQAVRGRTICDKQGPSLLKSFGGTKLIVSMTSPCSLNRSTTFL